MKPFNSKYTKKRGDTVSRAVMGTPGTVVDAADRVNAIGMALAGLSLHPAVSIARTLARAFVKPCARYTTESVFEEHARSVQGLNQLAKRAQRMAERLEETKRRLEEDAAEIDRERSSVRRNQIRLHAYKRIYYARKEFNEFSVEMGDVIGAAQMIVKNLQQLEPDFNEMEKHRREQKRILDRLHGQTRRM